MKAKGGSGSWVCENVEQTRKMQFWFKGRNFESNEINGLGELKLRASSRFAQETGKFGVFTQAGS
jgi:hypothetical protein